MPDVADSKLAARLLIVLPILAAVASPVGAWYVAAAQVEAHEAVISAHTARIDALEQYRASTVPVIDALKAHAADLSIHRGDDGLRVSVEREVRPLREAIASLQAAIPAQQRQLDRIERIVERLADRTAAKE